MFRNNFIFICWSEKFAFRDVCEYNVFTLIAKKWVKMTTKLDFSILKDITALAGISGREESLREYLKKLLTPYADSVSTDVMGNLTVYKKGSSDKKLLLCAHMDEVGLLITHVDEKGFLRFITVGGIDPRTLLAQRVRVETVGGTVLGIIGTKPAHITTEAERGKALGVKELFIDIGFPAEEAKKRVQAGAFAVLDRPYEEFGDGRICAKALDNRAGVFVLAELVRALKNPFYNVYAVFTTQEEVGLRGAVTAAYGIEADLSLCVDTTGAADIPNVAPQDYITAVGGGVGLTVLDARTITHPKLFAALKQICEEKNIHYQTRIAPRGGNDAGAVHLSKTGIPTCGLSIPTRNIHSNVEVISKEDVQNTFCLLQQVAEQGIKVSLDL